MRNVDIRQYMSAGEPLSGGEPFEPDAVPERYQLADIEDEATHGDLILFDSEGTEGAFITIDEAHVLDLAHDT